MEKYEMANGVPCSSGSAAKGASSSQYNYGGVVTMDSRQAAADTIKIN